MKDNTDERTTRQAATKPQAKTGKDSTMGNDTEVRDCRTCRHYPKGGEDFRKEPCCTCNSTWEPGGPWLNWVPIEPAPPGSKFQAPGLALRASAVSSPPATGSGLLTTNWEIASLQRRVLRDLGKLTPMLETMLAMEVAVGHITAAEVLHFVHDRDITRAICGRARRMIGLPPKAPVRPRLGLVCRVLARLGLPCDAERAYRARLDNHRDALASWQRRLAGATMPHQGDPPAMKAMKKADKLGEAGHPAGTADGPGAAAEVPLVKLGPGGDFGREIFTSALDAGSPWQD